MTATLSQSQADLPRLVELASQGEDVLINLGLVLDEDRADRVFCGGPKKQIPIWSNVRFLR